MENAIITFTVPFTQVFGAQVTKCSMGVAVTLGGFVNSTDMSPLLTIIYSLSTTGMTVDTAYGSNNKSPFLWFAYGYVQIPTSVPSSSLLSFPSSSYSFPSSSTSATTTSSSTVGSVTLANGFTLQWGYGKNQSTQTITFSPVFTQIFGAQISKSNCNNNTTLTGGIVNTVYQSPLLSFITSLTTTGLTVDTGYASYNKSEFFWIAYGLVSSYETSVPSPSLYSFTDSSLYLLPSFTSKGYIIMDSVTRFGIQWGYGPNANPLNNSVQLITFCTPFVYVFGAQITLSNCNNNLSYGSGIVNTTDVAPILTNIGSISTTGMYVDVGVNSYNKSEFFWIAFGIM